MPDASRVKENRRNWQLAVFGLFSASRDGYLLQREETEARVVDDVFNWSPVPAGMWLSRTQTLAKACTNQSQQLLLLTVAGFVATLFFFLMDLQRELIAATITLLKMSLLLGLPSSPLLEACLLLVFGIWLCGWAEDSSLA